MTKKTSGFRERSTKELEQLELDMRRELWQARFSNHTHQLDDTSTIGKLRRNIACVKTILTEREREASAS